MGYFRALHVQYHIILEQFMFNIMGDYRVDHVK